MLTPKVENQIMSTGALSIISKCVDPFKTSSILKEYNQNIVLDFLYQIEKILNTTPQTTGEILVLVHGSLPMQCVSQEISKEKLTVSERKESEETSTSRKRVSERKQLKKAVKRRKVRALMKHRKLSTLRIEEEKKLLFSTRPTQMHTTVNLSDEEASEDGQELTHFHFQGMNDGTIFNNPSTHRVFVFDSKGASNSIGLGSAHDGDRNHTSIGEVTTLVEREKGCVQSVTLGPCKLFSECANISISLARSDSSSENNVNRNCDLNNEFGEVTTVVERDKDCVQIEGKCVTLEPSTLCANTSISMARNDLSRNDDSNRASNFFNNGFGEVTTIGEYNKDCVQAEDEYVFDNELQCKKASEVMKQTAQIHKRLDLHSSEISFVDPAFESSSICTLMKETETIRLIPFPLLKRSRISEQHTYSRCSSKVFPHSHKLVDNKTLSRVHCQQEKVALSVAQMSQTGFVLPDVINGGIMLSTSAEDTCKAGIIPMVELIRARLVSAKNLHLFEITIIDTQRTLLEIPQDVLAPDYALTAKLSDPESSSDESGVGSNKEYKVKIRRKIIGSVPQRRQLLVFYSRREKKSKSKTRFKIHKQSDSENDYDLPNISQKKSYNTQKVRRQHLTLSRYSHVKLRCNTSGELSYMEADSYSQTEDSSRDLATDDVVDKSFPEDAKCVFSHHTAASTDTHLRKVQSVRGQLCNVLIKHKGSVVGTHVPQRRKNIRVQEVSSAYRGVRKIKQAHRVSTTSASDKPPILLAGLALPDTNTSTAQQTVFGMKCKLWTFGIKITEECGMFTEDTCQGHNAIGVCMAGMIPFVEEIIDRIRARLAFPVLDNLSIGNQALLLEITVQKLYFYGTLLEFPRGVLVPHLSDALTAKSKDLPISYLESFSDELGLERNDMLKPKVRRKRIGFVPHRRQLLVFYSRSEKKNNLKTNYELSDSEKDDDLPSIAQEKTYKTVKCRQQKVTLSRYSHASANLTYMEEDSYSQAEDTMDLDDVVLTLSNSFNPNNIVDQYSRQSREMNFVGNWKYVGNNCTPVTLIIEDANSYVFIPAPASTDTHLKRVQSPRGQLCYVLIKHKESVISTHIPRRRTNIHVSSACRGVRKTKQVHRVITTSASEISSDYSKSAIVLESYSQRNLFAIKALKTPTNDFVGIPSYEKLSQSNIGLVDQTTTSETSSQEQLSRYISATTVRTDSMRLPTLAAAKSSSVSSLRVPPAMAAESPVKSKGQKGRSLRVQVDGEQKASLLNTVTAASIPQSCSTRTSERNSPRENDSSLQRSIPTRRSPDWIAIATKLLHVPDYQKMIQILNGVTPAQEDVVAHKFIRGIAYFKVGKLRQAMNDLHECEKFALESIEDERRAHSQRQLDSGVFSMQPGSQASPQASSLQYLQQSSKKGDVAVCNVYMGDLHYTSGSYLEASKCYQRAADLYDRECVARLFRMVPPTISTIHSKCGSCLRNLSKSMEAIQEYRNAIETAIRDKDRLAAHTSLGNLQQTLGQNKEALVEYKHALDLAETLNEHMSVGWTHGNIGNAFLGLNEKDKALFHLQKALDITIKYEPKPDSIGRAYNNLGTAYQSMGDLDKAEEHYDLALSQAIYGNDPAGQSRVYGNIGNIYIVRKRFEKAIPHYTEVLRLSKDEATISTAHHNRGCALYEWAESKMLALEQSLQKTSSSNEPTFRFHGSQTTIPQKHSPRIVIDSIAKLFRDGMSDLQKVAETHEAKLDHIKGSAKGLSLSVSLTESNSRTFHRLQDCMVAIGNWREALLIAEQSRARTLGEIMLARKESQLEKALTSPLNLEHVYSIVSSQKSPVLYLTHTGASLFGWVLVPAEDSDSISIEMFEIPISDDQFNGKSFDYHIRYGLTEVLVEQSYEMYCSIDYDEETTAPVAQLFKVIGKPFQMTLDRLLPGNKKAKMQKIVLITDTYTSLLPFTCMYDPDSETFLGDHYYFETMQSLLTMGIMNQLPEPMVELPADPQSMCIVGNPIIPKFYLNGEVWSLGKLPYARREAQWVGHILNTPPILDEQATKSAVVMRFMRAKVIHIATHGSSVSGFLAFASLTSTRQGEGVDSSGVLLHPEEVEKLSISPALVVLSSCDSSRGTVKADGVQGMARAFLLAGAQAVLTALWRVPDESAAVFMRFFYRFLENGFESSLSLQKAILSLRCFSKYSQYIHWSGYQLTGRSIRLDMKPSLVTTILESTLRPSSPFPRLMLVKKLESVLVDNPRLPTDIQILHGSPGVKPSEIAIDFIHSCHAKFAAGIFWISCRTPDIIDASLKSIEKTIDKPLNKLRLSDTQQALVVLDNAIELPSSGKLISFLKHTNVHIIILSKSADPLDSFVKEVDKALIRGCSIHEVKTLSTIDSTQRIVYEISKQYYLKANNNDQAIFEKLAEFTSGSPLIVDIAAQVLLKFVQENSDEPSEGLNQFADSIQLSKSRKVVHKSPLASSLQGVEDTCFQMREISDALTHLVPNVTSVSPNHTDVWESESEYDSWDSIGALIQRCVSTPGEMLLLQALSIFGCIPIPIPLVTTMSSLIAQSSGHSHLAGILHERLMEAKLILRYPQPVVLHSTYTNLKGDKASEEPLFLYLPQHLASQLWLCNDIDQVMAVTVAYKALQKVIDENSPKNPELLHFYLGLIPPLEEKTALLAVEKKHCYEAVYELYLQLSHQLSSTNHTHI